MARNSFIDIKFSGFIDRKGVSSKFSREMFKPLVRAGALVRTIARRSIRKRKKSARPGQPPSSHTGMLKRFIFFSADREREEVVVGPMKLSSVESRNQNPPAPAAIEFGATVQQRGRQRRYKGNPFMGPAQDKALEKFPTLFRG